MKLPVTCATCKYSIKVVQEGWLWKCLADDDGRFIPCRRGQLPKPPRWCPLRKP